MADLVELQAFDELINPKNESLYVLNSAVPSKRKTLYDRATVSKLALFDTTSNIELCLPEGFVCIKFENPSLTKIIVDLDLKLPLFRVGSYYYCFAKDDGEIVNTTKNRLAIGINAETIAFQRRVKHTVILPYKDKANINPMLSISGVINMPSMIEELPKILKPLFKVSCPSVDPDINYPISNDEANTLIKIFKGLCNRRSFKLEEKKDIISYINENLMAKPLTPDELENLLQNNIKAAQVSEFFGEKGEFLHYIMGDYFINELYLKRDSSNGKLYYWDEDNKIYKTDDEIIGAYMTKLCPSLKDYQRMETLKYINSMLAMGKVVFNERKYNIVFKNGLLNVLTGDFQEMTPENLESIQINCNYNPNAVQSNADDFFKTASCNDKEIESLLYEAIGYSMVRTNELQKAFLLLGEGRNGKSTYFDIIKNILGKGNYTTVSFKDLNTTFRASALDNKLASLAGDISSQPIQESDLFKSIAVGEDIMIERKFEQAHEKSLFSTMFFAANKLPPTQDVSAGFFRRLCIIPFEATLAKISEVDGALFKEKLLSESNLEYIAYKATEAIKTVLTTKCCFTYSKRVEEMTEEYKNENSSPLAFFAEEYSSNVAKIIGKKKMVLYNEYESWCFSNKRLACKSVNFIKALTANFSIKVNDLQRIDYKQGNVNEDSEKTNEENSSKYFTNPLSQEQLKMEGIENIDEDVFGS